METEFYKTAKRSESWNLESSGQSFLLIKQGVELPTSVSQVSGANPENVWR